MDEKTYTITLEDGTVIDNLHLNGNNFISQEPIDQEIFYGNLGTVIISNGENEETHKNMELIKLDKIDDNYWFILMEIPESKIFMAKLRSDMDYLAMMTDINI